MGRPRRMAEIEAMTDAELVERYDEAAKTASGGLAFWRDEVERRERRSHDDRIADYTRRMYWLTVTIAIATLVNVLLFVLRP